MDVAAYLDRINASAPTLPNLKGLRALHRAHLLAIPFENLDVQLGRPASTEIGPIYEKLVEGRRGGWCFEMNGLFGWALGQLGFRVTRLAGGVMREAAGDSNVGNHLVLRVDLPEGAHLADVGFGDGPLLPTRLTPGPFSDGRFDFALSQPEPDWWRLHHHPQGAGSFDFRLMAADESLLADKCRLLQTAEASPFVQNLVCQRHTLEGVTLLRGRVLRRLTPGDAKDRLVESANDLLTVLRDEFGLDVPEAARLWPQIVARHKQLFGAN